MVGNRTKPRSWDNRLVTDESGGLDTPFAFVPGGGLLSRANSGRLGPADTPAELLLRGMPEGDVRARFALPAQPSSLAVSPDGALAVATGGYWGTWLVDLKGRTVTDLRLPFSTAAAFAADGHWFVVAQGGHLAVCDPAGGRLHQFNLESECGTLEVTHLAVARDGRVIAADDGGRVVDPDRDKVIRRGPPRVRLWMPGDPGTLLLREYPVFSGPDGMAIAPARDVLAVWSLTEIEVFRLDDLAMIARYAIDQPKHEGEVRGAAFLSDGSTLVIAAERTMAAGSGTRRRQPSLLLWDVIRREVSADLWGVRDDDPGYVIASSPDDLLFATTGLPWKEKAGLRVFTARE